MSSKRSREGYLLVDHRASPGLPADFYRNIGLSGPAVGEGAVYESPTMTCCHCNAIVILNPMRTRQRGYCARCDDYVCDAPVCNARCLPFNKVLDDAERQARRLFTKGNH